MSDLSKTKPRRAWRTRHWGVLTGVLAPLRPIFDELGEFLVRPTFPHGIEIGDGTDGTVDPETGVKTPPGTEVVTLETLQQPSPLVLAALDEMDAALGTLDAAMEELELELGVAAQAVEDLKTDPIPFTRITDVQIDTPHLRANAITAAKIAFGAITGEKIGAGAITAEKITADAITASKIAALYITGNKFIRSENFLSGVRGWAIDGNGVAEFNQVTVRGTVTASNVIGSNFYTSTTGARVFISGRSDSITFYNSAGQSSTLRQGNSIGLETSGSLRSLANLYATGAVVVSGTRMFLRCPQHRELWFGGTDGARDGILMAQIYYASTADSFVSYSDRRLKENIVDAAPGALATVASTPVREFTLKENAEMGHEAGAVHRGWIAQECPPEAVIEDSEGMLAVSQTKMVAILWQAVQELTAEVEALRDGKASK